VKIERGFSEAPRTWLTSSYSNGAGGECVECARDSEHVLVRDTKLGSVPVVAVGARAWAAFTGAIGRGGRGVSDRQ
jgi:hypothetical protein